MRRPPSAEPLERYKREAAERAAAHVESGMILGLGTGSTAIFAIRWIADRLRDGSLDGITGVATSIAVAAEARRLGIPLPAEMPPAIDLTIDGADEVDPELNLVKGGGGALLREKIVAQASRRVIVVADQSKLSAQLGSLAVLPLEVVPFGWRAQLGFVESLGAAATVRRAPGGRPVRTDQGNVILDCAFGPIDRPAELAARLAGRAGIVEHGLFLGLATDLIVSGPDGVRHERRP